jgi:hypothetical protein
VVGVDLVERFPITDLRHGLTVREARLGDIDWLAQKMTTLDVREIVSIDKSLTPADALVLSFRNSTMAWSVMRGHRTLAMFGVGIENIAGGIGNPWLLTTPELGRSARAIVRLAPSYVSAMQRHFTQLRGVVLDEHEPAKRLLTRLGFHLGEPFPGPTGAIFRVFKREEPN